MSFSRIPCLPIGHAAAVAVADDAGEDGKDKQCAKHNGNHFDGVVGILIALTRRGLNQTHDIPPDGPNPHWSHPLFSMDCTKRACHGQKQEAKEKKRWPHNHLVDTLEEVGGTDYQIPLVEALAKIAISF